MPGPNAYELLADLARAFPRNPFDTQTAKVYARELEDIPLPLLEVAVRELIRTGGDWLPSVSAIRKAAAERHLGLPTEAVALAQIEARIAWHRLAETARPPEPPDVHPLVKSVLDRVGGFYGYRSADDPGVIRGQFGRLFREERTREIRDAQVGNLALPPGPTLRNLPPPPEGESP